MNVAVIVIIASTATAVLVWNSITLIKDTRKKKNEKNKSE